MHFGAISLIFRGSLTHVDGLTLTGWGTFSTKLVWVGNGLATYSTPCFHYDPMVTDTQIVKIVEWVL